MQVLLAVPGYRVRGRVRVRARVGLRVGVGVRARVRALLVVPLADHG